MTTNEQAINMARAIFRVKGHLDSLFIAHGLVSLGIDFNEAYNTLMVAIYEMPEPLKEMAEGAQFEPVLTDLFD